MSRRCERCSRAYDPVLSRGAWACAWHPGTVDAERRRYTCCGRPVGAPGCERCDCGPDYGRVDAIPHFRAVMRRGQAIDVSMPGFDASVQRAWVIRWSASS